MSLLDDYKKVIEYHKESIPTEVYNNAKLITEKYPTIFNEDEYYIIVRTNGAITISSLDNTVEIDVLKKHISVRLIIEINGDKSKVRELSHRYIEFNKENLEKVIKFIQKFTDKIKLINQQ